jgi:hypothetical protein
VDDPESGTVSYVIEVRTPTTGGALQAHGTIDHPADRFDAVPSAADAVRVVAVNAAGLRGIGDTLGADKDDADVVYTLATVTNRSVARDDDVRINYFLAPGARYETALLIDRHGVEHTFSSTIVLGPRLHQAFARAASFEPGNYTAAVRVTDGGAPATYEAGNLTLLAAGEGPAPDGGPDGSPPPVERNEPAPAFLLVAAAVAVAVLFARRRRS